MHKFLTAASCPACNGQIKMSVDSHNQVKFECTNRKCWEGLINTGELEDYIAFGSGSSWDKLDSFNREIADFKNAAKQKRNRKKEASFGRTVIPADLLERGTRRKTGVIEEARGIRVVDGDTNMREENTMMNTKSMGKMFKSFGADFNVDAGKMFAYSMAGLAYKNAGGSYVVYNKERGEIIDVMDMIFDFADMVFVMPSQEVVANDVIIQNGVGYHVTSVSAGVVNAINLDRGESVALIAKTNLMGMKFYAKVVSMGSMFGGGNPMQAMMMMQMMGGDSGGDSNPMMQMMQMQMMGQMFGNSGAMDFGGNMFGGGMFGEPAKEKREVEEV